MTKPKPVRSERYQSAPHLSVVPKPKSSRRRPGGGFHTAVVASLWVWSVLIALCWLFELAGMWSFEFYRVATEKSALGVGIVGATGFYLVIWSVVGLPLWFLSAISKRKRGQEEPSH